MEIGSKIKGARVSCGLTQEQAAEKLMVSRQTISNWENGKSLPDIVSVMNMSDLYQISLDTLLKGDTKMKEKMEKDVKKYQVSRRFILVTGIFVFVTSVIRLISTYVGGAFEEFCDAAFPWVLMGLVIACLMTYLSDREEATKD
ncbi:MAG: helix-turn-helix transcriptional regulator [Lachnospiraceae bacterium]|nr:helix-turn-helix transcriptional regulator [Lachnospiraceae bacterium]